MKQIDRIIESALEEDIKSGDITTEAIISDNRPAIGIFLAKADGILSGVAVAQQVFELVDEEVVFNLFFEEGSAIKKGDIIAEVEGSAASILVAERTALNFLQRMSGIATAASEYAKAVVGTKAKILDTRKTAPGLRVTDKLAVKTGGCLNHRTGLYDMYLIKDNHIEAAGSISKAVKLVKEHQQENETSYKIEVEVKNIDELHEALESGVDVIMLDNFCVEDMIKAVEITNNNCLLEASGGITIENVREVAETGVDYISIGALTHTVTALDISLDLKLKPKE
ncbi:MAG: carboxylating nicotinate-nucleotide diphosphorylase [Ignavibacteriales bacterium]|nr:carboxylating nicotinate-nucleotide diphosphorylase [Ignavibacteriales bacterium]MCC6636857.1 carboxylating nicotinate-nucleotide diphosphorylase [Ignavibacteriaceae bacterium]